jgi:LAO/AO transport system kinase
VDIVKAADTTVVVLVPGLGDDIQAIKAGILEIGDIFAINKADREGVERLHTELEMMLDLGQGEMRWRPRIMRTVASLGNGVAELITTIDDHISYLKDSGDLARRRSQRTKNELVALLEEQINRYVLRQITESGRFAQLVASVEQREQDPYSIVFDLLKGFLR